MEEFSRRLYAPSADGALRGSKWFYERARGQYQDLSDADKLSKPAFEPMDSGVRLAGSGADWAAGVGADRNVRYESIIIDTLFAAVDSLEETVDRPFYEWLTLLFVHFRAGSAIARSSLSYANEKKRQPFAEKIAVNGDSYVVAFTKDNTSVSNNAVFASQTEAEQFMADSVAKSVAGAYPTVEYQKDVTLAAATTELHLGVRKPTDKDLDLKSH